MFGRTHSDKSRKKMSDTENFGHFKPGEDHSMFGRMGKSHPMFDKAYPASLKLLLKSLMLCLVNQDHKEQVNPFKI